MSCLRLLSTTAIHSFARNPVCFKLASEAQRAVPAITYLWDSRRWYNRKKSPSQGWKKPLSFDFSGDIQKELTPLDVTAIKPGFEDIKELEEMSPMR